ncbi:MAG: hypothetical protein ACTSWI_06840 [Alphaproteobacteria bacterium]
MRFTQSLRRLAGASIVAGAALAANGGAASAENAYLRIGVGFDWSQRAIFTDRDCNSGAPPALFGCSNGNDGLPIGAYGNFGTSSAFEFALGFRATPLVRLEAALSLRHTFDFVGDANFSNVADPQPVSAALSQASLIGWAYFDVPTSLPVQPFVGIGIGLSRNALSPVLFEFPTLTQPAWSETPPGTRISPAFGFAIGLAREMSYGVTIEIVYRHTNYGRVATDPGLMHQRRGGPEYSFGIDETWTTLVTNAVMFSLRWAITP